MFYPKSWQVYTTHQIYKDLILKDIPHLRCFGDVLQNSHFLPEDLLKIPGWSEIQWVYLKTTIEWIPLFDIHPKFEDKLRLLVDIEDGKKYSSMDADYLWITPKGLPREQY